MPLVWQWFWMDRPSLNSSLRWSVRLPDKCHLHESDGNLPPTRHSLACALSSPIPSHLLLDLFAAPLASHGTLVPEGKRAHS